MLDESTVLGIVSNELSLAELYTDYRTPLDFYLGNPNGREVDGRSTVVSTDVADAIEWIMPQVMRALLNNNEIVTFDPVNENDVEQAALESAYTYDILIKENKGFILLYTFIKDALLHNNGILKVFYDEQSIVKTEEITGWSEEAIAVLLQDPSIDLLSYSVDETNGTVSGVVQTTSKTGNIKVEVVSPENFLYNRGHNSIDLEYARFTAHVLIKTASDLIAQGVPEDIVDSIVNNVGEDRSYFRFIQQGESIGIKNSSLDPALAEVQIAECYMFMDYNEDGISEYRKITVAGVGSPTHVISNEEIDYCPWVATTGILMPHKFRGLSIYDRLKQIQEQKTALFRSALDNIYFQNNQRFAAVEGMVNLDDLMTSRPGGIVRVKKIDAVTPLATPQLNNTTFDMMQYLDTVRAGRVGVAPEGEAAPGNIGYRIGSEGVDRIFTAKEELVGLIIRTIAETGIKPLCIKIRDLANNHQDSVKQYFYRGKWLQFNPRNWTKRTTTTVRVGTGSGNNDKKLAAVTQILQFQSTIFQQQGQSLVTVDNIYAALDDFAKFSELSGANKYFTDPQTRQGQQLAANNKQMLDAQQQQATQIQLTQLQAEVQLAQAQMKMAETEQENVRLKGIVEGLKHKLDLAKADAEYAHKDADRRLKQHEINLKAAVDLAKVEATAQQNELEYTLEASERLNGEMNEPAE